MSRFLRSFLVLVFCFAFADTARAGKQLAITTTDTDFRWSWLDDCDTWLRSSGGVGVARTWTLVEGSLPQGATIDAASGRVRCRPNESGQVFQFTLSVRDAMGTSATKAFSVRVHPVPRPARANIPVTLSCIYMPKPRWPSHQWADLYYHSSRSGVRADFGQRMPLLGYYQGDNPDVLDWQIQFASPRGITNFMFNDYWVQGIARPVYATSMDAYLASRYGSDYTTFAMLYNGVDGPQHNAPRRAFFVDTVLPYYLANYFNRPNYLTIAGKPVIEILSWGAAFAPDTPERVAETLDAIDQRLGELTSAPGYVGPQWTGVYWMTSDIGSTTVDFSTAKRAGFDAVAPYYVDKYLWPNGNTALWPRHITSTDGNAVYPPGVEYSTFVDSSLVLHTQAFEAAAASGLDFVTAVNPDFDSRCIFWQGPQLYYHGQNMADYRRLLAGVATMVAAHPHTIPVSDRTGKPLVGLGPWNEQIESSSIEPGLTAFNRQPALGDDDCLGQEYMLANAAAEAFGVHDIHEYGVHWPHRPGSLSLGSPLEKRTWAFADDADVLRWQGLGNAVVRRLPGTQSMFVEAYSLPESVPHVPPTIMTACDTALSDFGAPIAGTRSYDVLHVRVRFLDAANFVTNVMLAWKAGTYDATSDEFWRVTPSAGEFSGGIFPKCMQGTWPCEANSTLPFGTTLVLDYDMRDPNAVAHWRGRLREIQLRFFTSIETRVSFQIESIWLTTHQAQ